jgi:acetyl esterase/lipase
MTNAMRLRYGPHKLHFGDLRLPAGPTGSRWPVVMVIHGGFWLAAYDLEYLGPACEALAQAGFATWSIEYRRIGHPGGGWPGTFHDVARAADHLRTLAQTYPLDLERVVTLGHSAGGHLALWLAARPRIPEHDPILYAAEAPLKLRGAVSLGGVVDLNWAWEHGLGDGAVESLMGGPPGRYADRYEVASPAALLPLGLPQVLVHGTEDDLVPIEISRVYHAAALGVRDPAALIIQPGAGHYEMLQPGSREWAQMVDSVRSMLDLRP